MADPSSDDWGCWIFALLALGGGYWLYNNYTIEKKGAPPVVVTPSQPKPLAPAKPSGLVWVTRLENGTIWRLDADSVAGPRSARQVWIKADHTSNKVETARETQTLYRINCDTTAYRTLKMVNYNAKGEVLRMWGEKEFGTTEDYPPPDSIIGTAVRKGCDPGYDAPGR